MNREEYIKELEELYKTAKEIKDIRTALNILSVLVKESYRDKK